LDRFIETNIAEVWISPLKKILVGSIYRPNVNHPTLSSSQQFDQFFDLFSNLLHDLTSLNIPIYLFGDFNLDALKYNIINKVTEYIKVSFFFWFTANGNETY
jgi:exonuclease III